MSKQLLKQITALNIEKTKDLLENFTTVELNNLDKDGNTILHLAIKVFLEKEKNLSNINKAGWISYTKTSATIINSIVSKMSDWAIHSINNDGFTAMHYAFKSGNDNISWAICGLNPPHFDKNCNILGNLEDNDYY
jgi:ankyrin repeat protein